MQRALLGKRKVGPKVYLSAIAVGLGVYLRKKFFRFFSLPGCHWEPPPPTPPHPLLTSRLGLKMFFMLV